MLDPGGVLDDLAHDLRARAAQLQSAGDDPVRALQNSDWTGRRSEQMAARLGDSQQRLHHTADELLQLATQADHLAAQYRTRIRALHDAESKVRSWMRSAAADQLKNFRYAATSLPAAGSPQWTLVLTAARQAGARL